jgi:hypothetical protein
MALAAEEDMYNKYVKWAEIEQLAPVGTYQLKQCKNVEKDSWIIVERRLKIKVIQPIFSTLFKCNTLMATRLNNVETFTLKHC